MSAAQCKAARRRLKNDTRYKPARGSRGLAKAMARNRKRAAAGQGLGSVGYSKRKG